jgi:hypothetical protein
MSSYGNHVWTPQLDLTVQRLVLAAMNGYDDEFAEILHSIAGINVGWPFGDDAPPMNCPNTAAAIGALFAATALLAEQLADATNADVDECPAVTHKLWHIGHRIRLAVGRLTRIPLVFFTNYLSVFDEPVIFCGPRAYGPK